MYNLQQSFSYFARGLRYWHDKAVVVLYKVRAGRNSAEVLEHVALVREAVREVDGFRVGS